MTFVMPEGEFVIPSTGHIADILTFARDWDRKQPFLVHCWAGISRSNRRGLYPAERHSWAWS